MVFADSHQAVISDLHFIAPESGGGEFSGYPGVLFEYQAVVCLPAVIARNTGFRGPGPITGFAAPSIKTSTG